MEIRPLKQRAKSIGGLIQIVLEQEPNEMTDQDYVAKCRTWLALIRLEADFRRTGKKLSAVPPDDGLPVTGRNLLRGRGRPKEEKICVKK
jgi:hypothetical protein